MRKKLFETGELRITQGVKESIPMDEAMWALFRHALGDGGDLCEEDKEMNEFAIRSGLLRVFSCYHSKKGQTFLIITEADHSVTTILLPSEY